MLPSKNIHHEHEQLVALTNKNCKNDLSMKEIF